MALYFETWLLCLLCFQVVASSEMDSPPSNNSPPVRRFVITFHGGNALDQYSSMAFAWTDAAVIDKWYGRRIILRFTNEHSIQQFLTSVEDVKDQFGNVQGIEEDAPMLGGQSYTDDDDDSSMHKIYQWAMDPAEKYSIHAWNSIDYGFQQSSIDMAMSALPTTKFVVAALDSCISDTVLKTFQAGAILRGYDFVSDTDVALDGDGRDSDWTDPGDHVEGRCNESSWHGTMTSTLLAADSHGSGFSGVSPAVHIVPIRVLGACSTGYASDVADAIVWSAGGDIRGLDVDTEKIAHIIMMPLSGFSGIQGCPTYLQSAVDFAVSRGVVLVAAAGNNFGMPASDYFPGNCKGVHSIGSMNRRGHLAMYSNTEAEFNLPGGDAMNPLTCMSYGEKIVQCKGTSFAAVYATGWIVDTINKKGYFQHGDVRNASYNSSLLLAMYSKVSRSNRSEYSLQGSHHSSPLCNVYVHFYTPWQCLTFPSYPAWTYWDCPLNSCTNKVYDEFCECVPGTYASKSGMRCATYLGNHASGRWEGWPMANDDITCDYCPGGSYCPGGVDTGSIPHPHRQPILCSQCPKGKYNSGGCNIFIDRICGDCVAGLTFSNQPNLAACTPCAKNCPSGQYISSSCTVTTDTGCTGCATCAAGKKIAKDCSAGLTQMECANCESNQYSSAGSTACNPCTVCPAGKKRTKNCDVGSDADCIACDPGYFSVADSLLCVLCNSPGFYWNGRECAPCPAGTSVATGGQLTCSPCKSGNVSIAGQAQCSFCQPAKFARSSTECSYCYPGKYNAGNIELTDCRICPDGKISMADQALRSDCAVCGEGKYADTTKTVCKDCPAGSFWGGGTTGTTICTACPDGHASATGAKLCTACGPGKFANPTVNSCEICTAGKYSTAAANALCKSCKSGKFSSFLNAASESTCTPCKGSWYSGIDGASICLACPKDFDVNAAHTGSL
jgi:hypothetical protein